MINTLDSRDEEDQKDLATESINNNNNNSLSSKGKPGLPSVKIVLMGTTNDKAKSNIPPEYCNSESNFLRKPVKHKSLLSILQNSLFGGDSKKSNETKAAPLGRGGKRNNNILTRIYTK